MKMVPVLKNELYERGGSQVVLPDDRHMMKLMRGMA